MDDNDTIIDNKYRLGKLLGQGSFGVVFLVCDISDKNKIYALKQIPKDKVDDQYKLEALKKEIHIMYELEHENSVKLYRHFSTENYYNLLMEKCDNDLDELLKSHYKKEKKGFNELELWMIMNQFNKIFKKMTEKDIIHRDLKLKNIMIKIAPNVEFIKFIVKLADFGFSKKLTDEDLTGTQLGTPATQAPETYLGKYNKKADLWSIGIIIYQLLYKKLPFTSTNKVDLKTEKLRWISVKLPEKSNNPISDKCFDLINRLLQRDPNKRISFEDYFNHKFFSEEHKRKLIEKYGQAQNEDKNELNDNKEKKIQNENNKEKEKLEKKKIVIIEITDFDKKFKKIIPIKEYNGYILYKGKDLINNRNVYIKEISRQLIDKNDKNKKIFEKEIELLSLLKGKNFPEFIGLSKTDSHYNIIIEYFSGKILDDYISHNKKDLDKSFYNLIFTKLKPSFLEMKEQNICLNRISSNNFAFSFFQNKDNFDIKFFDYGLISIFCDVNNLTFKVEEILESNAENKNILEKKEPIIKDDEMENILVEIKDKINCVYDYFSKLLENKENLLDNRIFTEYQKEIIIFLYFCSLECQTIIKFLKINADSDIPEIHKTIQEMHFVKIFLSKENDKYNYSNINFENESKNNQSYFYNKENPTFDYFYKIFESLRKKIDEVYIKFEQIDENNLYNEKKAKEIDNSSIILISNSDLVDKENNTLGRKMNFGNKYIEFNLREGNIDKLFLKIFENVILNYTLGKKDKIIDELNVTKYLVEYIIFMKAILGNITQKVNVDKIFENKDGDKDTVSFSTFIGGKISLLKEKGILNNNKSEEELKGEYNKMIKFYEKIDKLIKKIK